MDRNKWAKRAERNRNDGIPKKERGAASGQQGRDVEPAGAGLGGRENVEHVDGDTHPPRTVGVSKAVGGVGRRNDFIPGTPAPFKPKGLKERVAYWGGKRAGKELREYMEDRAVSEQEKLDGAFALSTNLRSTLKIAISVVIGLVAAYTGKHVLIDDATITSTLDDLNGALIALGTVITFVSALWGSLSNLRKNWDKVKTNGVKVSHNSTGLVFDFVPKQEDGFMLLKLNVFVAAVCVIAIALSAGCATSARESLVEQGGVDSQRLSDLMGEAQTTTLDGLLKFFETKKSHQITNVATWKLDAETKGTAGTPENQFLFAQLNLGIQSTENKIAFVKALKAEAATVPVGSVPVTTK